MYFDSLIACEQTTSSSALHVVEENIFTEGGYFTEPGLIENIAQTVAAGACYYFRNSGEGGEEVPIGYIGAIKDLNIHFLPEVNSNLTTEIKMIHEIFDITIIEGKVICKGKLAAECTMKIFIDRSNELFRA